MIFYRGMKGPKIEELQKLINKQLGYDCCDVDGIYGSETVKCIKAFQKFNGLNVDGIVGPETLNSLGIDMHLFDDNIRKLDFTPSYKQLFDVFGDFRIPGWINDNLGICNISEYASYFKHVVYSWKNINAFEHRDFYGIKCHKKITLNLKNVFTEIVRNNLCDKIKTYDGCYNVRYMRGARKWSTHSWAIALDFNAQTNKFGQKDFDMDERIVKIFEANGFIWGGRWRRPDAMHFQFCK